MNPSAQKTSGTPAMKIKVNDIPESGLTLTESFDPVAMDLQAPNASFEAPLKVTAAFLREADAVIVDVVVSGRMQLVCSRCLETVQREYDGRYQFGYPVKGEVWLDVTPDIRQEILLEYPMKPLCKEDCRGLCSRCGANLNEGACGCPPTGRT